VRLCCFSLASVRRALAFGAGALTPAGRLLVTGLESSLGAVGLLLRLEAQVSGLLALGRGRATALGGP